MKKILGILGGIITTAAPITSVISCTDYSKSDEFKSWIKNKETFLLFIGANDCEFCNKFETSISSVSGKKYLEQQSKDFVKDYNDNVANDKHNHKNFTTDPVTGFGDKIDTISLKTLKADKHEGLFSEKGWAKEILEWVKDELNQMFKDAHFNNWKGTKSDKEKITNYFSGYGTPFFILIRGGHLVVTYTGYSNNNETSPSLDLEVLVKEFKQAFVSNDSANIMFDKINGSTNTNDGEEKSLYSDQAILKYSENWNK